MYVNLNQPSPEQVLQQNRQMVDNMDKAMNNQMDQAALVNGNGQSGATYMATREDRKSRFKPDTFSNGYQPTQVVEERFLNLPNGVQESQTFFQNNVPNVSPEQAATNRYIAGGGQTSFNSQNNGPQLFNSANASERSSERVEVGPDGKEVRLDYSDTPQGIPLIQAKHQNTKPNVDTGPNSYILPEGGYSDRGVAPKVSEYVEPQPTYPLNLPPVEVKPNTLLDSRYANLVEEETGRNLYGLRVGTDEYGVKVPGPNATPEDYKAYQIEKNNRISNGAKKLPAPEGYEYSKEGLRLKNNPNRQPTTELEGALKKGTLTAMGADVQQNPVFPDLLNDPSQAKEPLVVEEGNKVEVDQTVVDPNDPNNPDKDTNVKKTTDKVSGNTEVEAESNTPPPPPEPADPIIRMEIQGQLMSPRHKGFFSSLFGDLNNSQVKKSLALGGLMAYAGHKSGMDLGESLATGLYGAIAQYNYNPDEMAAKKLAFEYSKYISKDNQVKVNNLISKGKYAEAKAIISEDWQHYNLLEGGKYVVDERTGKLTLKDLSSQGQAAAQAASGPSYADQTARLNYNLAVEKHNMELTEKQMTLSKEKQSNIREAQAAALPLFKTMNTAVELLSSGDGELAHLFSFSGPKWTQLLSAGGLEDRQNLVHLLAQMGDQELKDAIATFSGAISGEELREALTMAKNQMGSTDKQLREYLSRKIPTLGAQIEKATHGYVQPKFQKGKSWANKVDFTYKDGYNSDVYGFQRSSLFGH